MSILSWLFGRHSAPEGQAETKPFLHDATPQTRPELHLDGDGTFSQEVVGESHYQEALEGIVGRRTDSSADFRCTAELVRDRLNTYDPNAVGIFIMGQKVGHLPRDLAAAVAPRLDRYPLNAHRVTCAARIVGGWRRDGVEANFGVQLDVA